MKLSVQGISQWLAVFEEIQSKGAPVFAAFKAFLSQHGIEADISELDQVIADAERRKALAETEADGTTA